MSALANTADGAILVDAQQRILYWNHGTERLLGYKSAEVMNRHCYEVLGGRCEDGVCCHASCTVFLRVQQGRLPRNFDLLSYTKEGRPLWLTVITIALSRKKNFWLMHLLIDIDHRKQREQIIQKVSALLASKTIQPPISTPEAVPSDNIRVLDNQLAVLTRRETETLLLLAAGRSTAEIAKRIGVSIFTVRNHIRNALRKLGLHSRAEAIAFAFAHGLARGHLQSRRRSD